MNSSLLGHFHPVLVHLPIGILLLAFLFELLSRIKGYRKLKYAVRPSLFLGAVAAVFAAVTGYWLSQEGGYDEHLLLVHRNLGIGTAILAVLVYIHRRYSIIRGKRNRRQIRLLLFMVLAAAVAATGHYGGSLTHGADYLFGGGDDEQVQAMSSSAVTDPATATVYADVIRPILEQKCFGCHSAKKQKGQLRMDTREWIEKGGKHGAIFVSGNPEESEMFKRITLSMEEEHHMPPRERSQLTSLEIDVIGSWIEEGASFDQPVRTLKDPTLALEFLKTKSSESDNRLPNEEVAAPDEDAVKMLGDSGVVVLPVSADSHYLMINFSNKRNATARDAGLVKSLAANIVELDLSGCQVSPEMMEAVGGLTALRKLSLRKSSCSDADLKKLGTLKNLSVLNVSSTGVTDEGIQLLKNSSLKEIFLYQTKVTTSGVLALKSLLPSIRIDTGNYRLPFLASDTVQYGRK